jgi:putative transposase
MARPGRNASPDDILRPARTFFVTTKTSMGKSLFQTERNAFLLVDILRSLVKERAFELHDFVIMPDHLHMLLTMHEATTVEKAMQLIKGRFSFQLKKDLGFSGEVWQRGFSEVQVMNRTSFEAHRKYIAENPVKAGLVDSADEYRFCFSYLARAKTSANHPAIEAQQGLKPTIV